MADLPTRIMVWHSMPGIKHTGSWATTRYPEEASEYVPARQLAAMREAAQMGLDMALANDLPKTAEYIREKMKGKTDG